MKGIKMSDVKMVILVREDLGMSPGKVAAQTAHAGLTWLAEKMGQGTALTPNQRKWLYGEPHVLRTTNCFGAMKKIVLSVKDYSQLKEYEDMAKQSGLIVNKIFDEGMRAYTCLAIGPNNEDEIDKLTKKLCLYDPLTKCDYNYIIFLYMLVGGMLLFATFCMWKALSGFWGI